MGKVRVLPDGVANRIAAGEVVERPASVVKELVENAVDAGAVRIQVRLEEAGKRLVEVADDGEGMSREDALLALERHATSKIWRAEDLFQIRTLGFRGEALPSIASVSRFRLRTRTEQSQEGTEVVVEGGRVLSVRAAGVPKGTTVEVRDLFFNVPARRKFLKSDATELRNCTDTVTLLALVHHDVGFELRSGARAVLSVPPGQSLEERAEELAGAEAGGRLYWSRWEDGPRALAFAFAPPHLGRGHRKGLRLFVNGRPVADRLLLRAVMEGYRGLLETGRYPLALLWLDLPPEEVDVNVHPAKREVRFRDEGKVFRWVAGCVGEALSGAPWARSGSGGPASRGGGMPAGKAAPEEPCRPRVAEAVERYGRHSAAAAGGARSFPARPRPPAEKPVFPPLLGERAFPGKPAGPDRPRWMESPFGRLRFLGVLHAVYLLLEDADSGDLVIIDQHAAHERVLYETLLSGKKDGRLGGQRLLVPVTLECSPAEMAAHEERKDVLEALGLCVEPFGSRALAVTEGPAGLSPGALEALVRDVLSGDPPEGAQPGRDALDAWARRAACAAAVKAGRVLHPEEVAALLERLGRLKHPGHCPHGRPLVVRLGRRELEEMFRRG